MLHIKIGSLRANIGGAAFDKPIHAMRDQYQQARQARRELMRSIGATHAVINGANLVGFVFDPEMVPDPRLWSPAGSRDPQSPGRTPGWSDDTDEDNIHWFRPNHYVDRGMALAQRLSTEMRLPRVYEVLEDVGLNAWFWSMPRQTLYTGIDLQGAHLRAGLPGRRVVGVDDPMPREHMPTPSPFGAGTVTAPHSLFTITPRMR